MGFNSAFKGLNIMYLFATSQTLFETFLDRVGIKLGSIILREEHLMRESNEDIWCKMD